MSRLAFWSAALCGIVAVTTTSAPAQDAGQDAAARRKSWPPRPDASKDRETPCRLALRYRNRRNRDRAAGRLVSAGDLLVRIAYHDIKAQLAARVTEHDAAEAFHRKLVNGARREDIDIAQAELKLAEARLSEAQTRVIRSSTLFERSAVSQATRDVDERDVRVAAAQLDAGPPSVATLEGRHAREELAGKCKKWHARHQIEVAKSELSKCDVKSPVAESSCKHVSEGGW